MTFRVGDTVRRQGFRALWRVKKVNGNKLGVKPLSLIEGRENVEVGDLQTLSDRNFELVHTDWKEYEFWMILWRRPGGDRVREFVLPSEERANQNLQAMRAEPRDYEVISTHKITLPYKDLQ